MGDLPTELFFIVARLRAVWNSTSAADASMLVKRVHPHAPIPRARAAKIAVDHRSRLTARFFSPAQHSSLSTPRYFLAAKCVR